MTAASSICKIRLSCSTTLSTSNWKALAIAVLLAQVIFLIGRTNILTRIRPIPNERAGKINAQRDARRQRADAALTEIDSSSILFRLTL